VNSISVRSAPAPGEVLREQIRTVLGATRAETIGVGMLLLFVTAMYVLDAAIGGPEPFGFDWSERLGAAAVLGFFAAIAVWRGEDPSRRSYMWAMPVDRTRHTLTKILSGWLWVMGLLAVLVGLSLLASLVTGGEMGVQTERVAFYEVATGAVPDREIVEHGWLRLPGWMVLVPFTGVTIAYLLGTVPVAMSAHPWRWFAVAVVVVLFGGATLDMVGLGSVAGWIFQGPFNPELVFTGRTGVDGTAMMNGTLYRVRDYTPARAEWAFAALGWLTVSLVGVIIGAYRYQER
jgi:hypothetical protein